MEHPNDDHPSWGFTLEGNEVWVDDMKEKVSSLHIKPSMSKGGQPSEIRERAEQLCLDPLGDSRTGLASEVDHNVFKISKSRARKSKAHRLQL